MIAALSLVVAIDRDWFDWSVLIVGTIAAATGILGVILAGVLLWRDRPECELSRARFLRGSGDRWTIGIDFHIVASGSWVLKGEPEVSFVVDGKPVEFMRTDTTPLRGVGALTGTFFYEMAKPTTDTEVSVTVRFKRGGKTAKFHGTVPPRI